MMELNWRGVKVRRQLWRGVLVWEKLAYRPFSSIRLLDGGRGVCVTTWAGEDYMQMRVWF